MQALSHGDLFARVRADLGDRGAVELVAVASYYSGVARFLQVLDVDVEGDMELLPDADGPR